MRRARVLILFAIILLLGAAALYLIISRGGGDEPSPDVTPEGVIPSDIVFVAIAAQDIAGVRGFPMTASLCHVCPPIWSSRP